MNVEPYTHLNIREQLLQESHSMAKYALSNGNQVPVEVLKTIEDYARHPAHKAANDASPPPENLDLQPLVLAHRTLSGIVKPALPRTLLLLDRERNTTNRFLHIFGPVPIIRQMMAAALVCLACFILLSLSKDVAVNEGNMLRSHGWVLLQNLMFFLAAAGLGAGFAALYKANTYITQRTFDPTFHATYWIRFCLGLISGLVLSVMVADNAIVSAKSALDATSAAGSERFLDPAFLRPMLAMLGGFSAELLYTILNRLVETVGSLFQGSTKNLIEMNRQDSETRLAADKVQGRIELAAKLVKLQQEIANAANPTEIQTKLDQMLKDVMPDNGTT